MNTGSIKDRIPTSEIPSIPKATKETIGQLKKAAEKGLKELSTSSSGNTIVHETVRLHDYRLFKAIFKNGTPYVNTPNDNGSTPLLEAVRLGDYNLVEELLEMGADLSINTANKKGLTPVHAAVATGNTRLVQLLIKHGAEESINVPSDKKMTPLQIAVSNNDEKMTKLLLRHRTLDSIDAKDELGLSPFQWAIIKGKISTVKRMLELKPELAEKINKPDIHGITNFQRAVRTGNLELVSFLLAHMIDDEIRVNEEAYLPTEEAKEIRSASDMEKLKELSIDNVAFPLTIAQNNCNVLVRLNNNEILRLRNANAKEVRDYLMEKKYGAEWKSQEGPNILTFYVSPGHGFMRLECQNCDDGQPHDMTHGFYPKGGLKLKDARFKYKPEIPQKEQIQKGPTAEMDNASFHQLMEEIDAENAQELSEANMIFTITPNMDKVSLKTPSGELSMSKNTFDVMMSSLMEPEANPQDIAKEVYRRVKQELSDGTQPPPKLKDIERTVTYFHNRKITVHNLAEWMKQNLTKETPGGQESVPLSQEEISEMIDYLILPPTDASPGSDPLLDTLFPLGLLQSNAIKVPADTAKNLIRTLKPSFPSLRETAKGTIAFIPGGQSAWSYGGEWVRWYLYQVKPGVATLGDQIGAVSHEDEAEALSDQKNFLKLMFHVSDEQAKAALDTIKEVSLSCAKNPEKSCRYHLYQRNCMDFLQEVFTSAGGVGDFMDYLTDKQLGHGYLNSADRIYEFKAIVFGFIRSRGMPHYLARGIYQKLNEIFNLYAWTGEETTEGKPSLLSLPNKFVKIEQATEKEIPMPTYNVSLSDNIMLAQAIAKMSTNFFKGLSDFWLQSGPGVPGSLNTIWDLRHDGMETIKSTLNRQDRLEDLINAELGRINEEMDLLYKQLKEQEALDEDLVEDLLDYREKIIELSDKQIDLYMEGLDLKKQIKRLGQIHTTPNQAFLERLERKTQEFETKSSDLLKEFAEHSKLPLAKVLASSIPTSWLPLVPGFQGK